MSKLITIATFDNPLTANIIKGKLEASGIPCTLADEHIVSVQWLYSTAVGGIKLKVLDHDKERALEVLNEVDMPLPEEAFNGKSFSGPLCPKCGSDNIASRTLSKWVIALSWLTFGIPLPFYKKKAHCYECGYEWKTEE